MNTKVNENRLRRVADRQGLQLRKSRRRDPNAVDYGLYALIKRSGSTIHPHEVISEYVLTLEDVGLYLEGFDSPTPETLAKLGQGLDFLGQIIPN